MKITIYQWKEIIIVTYNVPETFNSGWNKSSFCIQLKKFDASSKNYKNWTILFEIILSTLLKMFKDKIVGKLFIRLSNLGTLFYRQFFDVYIFDNSKYENFVSENRLFRGIHSVLKSRLHVFFQRYLNIEKPSL